MNLNSRDGHIMDCTTGWDDEDDIERVNTSFTKGYLNVEIWRKPINRIAIARHQKVYVITLLLAKLR